MKRRKPAKKRAQRARRETLRQTVREAAKTGAAEAVEHCKNFWGSSDGYRRYVNANVEVEAEALKAAVRDTLRDELKLFRECEVVLRKAAGLAELAMAARRRRSTRTKPAQGRRRRRKKIASV
jgi:hypothetical protein